MSENGKNMFCLIVEKNLKKKKIIVECEDEGHNQIYVV